MLNPKQIKFCHEYLIDLNSAQAAIRAGYSVKTARSIGQRLLTNVDIQLYLQKLQQDQQQRTQITADMVIKELGIIAFSRIDDFVTVTERELPASSAENLRDDEPDEMMSYKVVNIKPTKDIPVDKMPAVSGIKQGAKGIELKMHDKVKSLELLGQHFGIFDAHNKQLKPDALPTIINIIHDDGPDTTAKNS